MAQYTRDDHILIALYDVVKEFDYSEAHFEDVARGHAENTSSEAADLRTWASAQWKGLLGPDRHEVIHSSVNRAKEGMDDGNFWNANDWKSRLRRVVLHMFLDSLLAFCEDPGKENARILSQSSIDIATTAEDAFKRLEIILGDVYTNARDYEESGLRTHCKEGALWRNFSGDSRYSIFQNCITRIFQECQSEPRLFTLGWRGNNDEKPAAGKPAHDVDTNLPGIRDWATPQDPNPYPALREWTVRIFAQEIQDCLNSNSGSPLAPCGWLSAYDDVPGLDTMDGIKQRSININTKIAFVQNWMQSIEGLTFEEVLASASPPSSLPGSPAAAPDSAGSPKPF